MKFRYQCIKHKRFPSKEIAEKSMKAAIIKWNVNLKRVFECPWCSGWHLTSK